MRIHETSQPAGAAAALALSALAVGVILFAGSTAALDWDVEAIVLTAVVPGLLMLYDYRLGLGLLFFILPFENAQFLPKIGPLNALNVLILGVAVSFLLLAALRGMTARPLMVLVPRQLFWFYAVPLTVAVVVGTTHFREMSAFYLLKTHPEGYKITTYWISDYFKHLLLVAAACVLASTVYQARSGRRWIALFTLAALLFVVAEIALTALSGGVATAVGQRNFLAYLGRQNNEAGVMLVTAFGPILFMREMVKTPWLRFALTVAALLMIVAVVLTGSRGAFVGLAVVVGLYLLRFRRLRTAFLAVTVALIGVAVAPDAVQDRLLRGLGNERAPTIDLTRGDELSAGRFYIWANLAPEIARSPLYGRGLLSTQWSRYVRSGAFRAGHPHNLYLEILMDGGIYGAICMFVFYRFVWRSFRRLGKDERFGGGTRGFFLGAAAGMAGMLTYGFTNGHWYPAPEQVFFWLAVGLAIGYSRIAEELPQPVALEPLKTRGARRHGMRHLEPAWR